MCGAGDYAMPWVGLNLANLSPEMLMALSGNTLIMQMQQVI